MVGRGISPSPETCRGFSPAPLTRAGPGISWKTEQFKGSLSPFLSPLLGQPTTSPNPPSTHSPARALPHRSGMTCMVAAMVCDPRAWGSQFTSSKGAWWFTHPPSPGGQPAATNHDLKRSQGERGGGRGAGNGDVSCLRPRPVPTTLAWPPPDTMTALHGHTGHQQSRDRMASCLHCTLHS